MGREDFKIDSCFAKPERTVTVVGGGCVRYSAEHAPHHSPRLRPEVLKLYVHSKNVQFQRRVGTCSGRAYSLHIFVAVNCSHMRCELVWPGESRRSSALYTSNHRAPERSFRRVLGCNMPLKLPWPTKCPGVAAASVVTGQSLPVHGLRIAWDRGLNCSSALISREEKVVTCKSCASFQSVNVEVSGLEPGHERSPRRALQRCRVRDGPAVPCS